MTAEFNMNVLDTFNKAVFDNENAIVNFQFCRQGK